MLCIAVDRHQRLEVRSGITTPVDRHGLPGSDEPVSLETTLLTGMPETADPSPRTLGTTSWTVGDWLTAGTFFFLVSERKF
jgi:hypothetical protein